MCSIKKLSLEILENLQKNICARVSFFDKVKAFRPINSIIKQYCSCCIMLIRIDTILSKNIQNNFQSLLLKKLLAQLGDQTDVYWKFYLPADTVRLPKTTGLALGYTSECCQYCCWLYHYFQFCQLDFWLFLTSTT